MRLNTIKPHEGAKSPRKRPGRGAGSGIGKTAGRGHKGQKARSGGFHKVGFEGGQMPLQRRLPKIGFRSRKSAGTDEIRLHELAGLETDTIDFAVLKAAGLVSRNTRRVKVIATGKLEKAVTVKGIAVTKGARAAIEAAGGKVIEE